jgi:hypothetical protein
MPGISSSAEASAIEDAYSEQIRGLFKVLFTNLIDQPGSDQQSASRFATGMTRAKRARDLALAAIESPAAETRALARSTRSRALPGSMQRRKKKASR